MSLVDASSGAEAGVSLFFRVHIMACDRIRPSDLGPPLSTEAVDGFAVSYHAAAGKERVYACGKIRLSGRSVYGIVDGLLDGSAGARQAAQAVLPALQQALVQGAAQAPPPVTDFPEQIPDNHIRPLPLLDGRRQSVPESKQVWTQVKSDPNTVNYEQIAPYVGTARAQFGWAKGENCSAHMATIDRARTGVLVPDGFTLGATDGVYHWLCRKVNAGKLLIVKVDSPLSPARAFAHMGPFLSAMAKATTATAKEDSTEKEPTLIAQTKRADSVNLPKPPDYESYSDRIRRMAKIQEDAAVARGQLTKRIENRTELRAEQIRIRKEIAEKNRRAKAEAKSVNEIPVDHMLFGALGWRIWLNAPSRVPESADADDLAGFDGMVSALSGQVGGIVNNIYAAGSFDAYRGSVRDGASPRIYQVTAGYGMAAKVWSSGGPVQVKSYDSEWLDQYGKPCPKVDKDMDESEIKDKLRGVKCGSYIRTTESTATLNMPSGWGKNWFSAYGGYRYVNDMLGGESGDMDRPLVGGGGPMVGANAVLGFGALALEFNSELALYLHGWNDHGRVGYNGRVGFGASIALVDIRWRLDSGVGKEFMFGIQARYDAFDWF